MVRHNKDPLDYRHDSKIAEVPGLRVALVHLNPQPADPQENKEREY